MAAGDQSAGPAPVAGEPSADVARGLRDPAVYGVEEVEVRETHISWVFLAGERAYKLKKPVRLPFVDYGTAERRRHMCEEEVRLNRRLAADVYLGVRAVVRGGGRLELDEPDHPDAVAHVVEMRRFDERRTLAALLGRGEPGSLEPLARLLARFHDAAPVIERADPVGALRDTLEENSATLGGLVPGAHAADVNALDRFAWSYLAAHEGRIRRRARAGRVRDGHGDLRTDHVLLEDGPRVVDCVEFAPHLRQIDTANDLSYLVMDLVARRAPTAAQQLLDAYRAAGGDAGDDGLLAFFAAYRASVAAKVAFMRGGREEEAAGVARLALGRRFAWRARLPLVLVVGGVSASGKSWLAERLGDRDGAPVISSDRVRKRLAGVPEGTRLDPEHYSDAARERVYRELGSLAAQVLRRAGAVIVDATFEHEGQREAFAAALGEAPTVFVRCSASRAVLRERARRRLRDPDRASDATVEVLERQLGGREPLPGATVIDTEQPPAAALDAVDAALDAALRDGSGRPHHHGAIPLLVRG